MSKPHDSTKGLGFADETDAFGHGLVKTTTISANSLIDRPLSSLRLSITSKPIIMPSPTSAAKSQSSTQMYHTSNASPVTHTPSSNTSTPAAQRTPIFRNNSPTELPIKFPWRRNHTPTHAQLTKTPPRLTRPPNARQRSSNNPDTNHSDAAYHSDHTGLFSLHTSQQSPQYNAAYDSYGHGRWQSLARGGVSFSSSGKGSRARSSPIDSPLVDFVDGSIYRRFKLDTESPNDSHEHTTPLPTHLEEEQLLFQISSLSKPPDASLASNQRNVSTSLEITNGNCDRYTELHTGAKKQRTLDAHCHADSKVVSTSFSPVQYDQQDDGYQLPPTVKIDCRQPELTQCNQGGPSAFATQAKVVLSDKAARLLGLPEALVMAEAVDGVNSQHTNPFFTSRAQQAALHNNDNGFPKLNPQEFPPPYAALRKMSSLPHVIDHNLAEPVREVTFPEDLSRDRVNLSRHMNKQSVSLSVPSQNLPASLSLPSNFTKFSLELPSQASLADPYSITTSADALNEPMTRPSPPFPAHNVQHSRALTDSRKAVAEKLPSTTTLPRKPTLSKVAKVLGADEVSLQKYVTPCDNDDALMRTPSGYSSDSSRNAPFKNGHTDMIDVNNSFNSAVTRGRVSHRIASMSRPPTDRESGKTFSQDKNSHSHSRGRSSNHTDALATMEAPENGNISFASSKPHPSADKPLQQDPFIVSQGSQDWQSFSSRNNTRTSTQSPFPNNLDDNMRMANMPPHRRVRQASNRHDPGIASLEDTKSRRIDPLSNGLGLLSGIHSFGNASFFVKNQNPSFRNSSRRRAENTKTDRSADATTAKTRRTRRRLSCHSVGHEHSHGEHTSTPARGKIGGDAVDAEGIHQCCADVEESNNLLLLAELQAKTPEALEGDWEQRLGNFGRESGKYFPMRESSTHSAHPHADATDGNCNTNPAENVPRSHKRTSRNPGLNRNAVATVGSTELLSTNRVMGGEDGLHGKQTLPGIDLHVSLDSLSADVYAECKQSVLQQVNALSQHDNGHMIASNRGNIPADADIPSGNSGTERKIRKGRPPTPAHALLRGQALLASSPTADVSTAAKGALPIAETVSPITEERFRSPSPATSILLSTTDKLRVEGGNNEKGANLHEHAPNATNLEATFVCDAPLRIQGIPKKYLVNILYPTQDPLEAAETTYLDVGVARRRETHGKCQQSDTFDVPDTADAADTVKAPYAASQPDLERLAAEAHGSIMTHPASRRAPDMSTDAGLDTCPTESVDIAPQDRVSMSASPLLATATASPAVPSAAVLTSGIADVEISRAGPVSADQFVVEAVRKCEDVKISRSLDLHLGYRRKQHIAMWSIVNVLDASTIDDKKDKHMSRQNKHIAANTSLPNQPQVTPESHIPNISANELSILPRVTVINDAESNSHMNTLLESSSHLQTIKSPNYGNFRRRLNCSLDSITTKNGAPAWLWVWGHHSAVVRPRASKRLWLGLGALQEVGWHTGEDTDSDQAALDMMSVLINAERDGRDAGARAVPHDTRATATSDVHAVTAQVHEAAGGALRHKPPATQSAMTSPIAISRHGDALATQIPHLASNPAVRVTEPPTSSEGVQSAPLMPLMQWQRNAIGNVTTREWSVRIGEVISAAARAIGKTVSEKFPEILGNSRDGHVTAGEEGDTAHDVLAIPPLLKGSVNHTPITSQIATDLPQPTAIIPSGSAHPPAYALPSGRRRSLNDLSVHAHDPQRVARPHETRLVQQQKIESRFAGSAWPNSATLDPSDIRGQQKSVEMRLKPRFTEVGRDLAIRNVGNSSEKTDSVLIPNALEETEHPRRRSLPPFVILEVVHTPAKKRLDDAGMYGPANENSGRGEGARENGLTEKRYEQPQTQSTVAIDQVTDTEAQETRSADNAVQNMPNEERNPQRRSRWLLRHKVSFNTRNGAKAWNTAVPANLSLHLASHGSPHGIVRSVGAMDADTVWPAEMHVVGTHNSAHVVKPPISSKKYNTAPSIKNATAHHCNDGQVTEDTRQLCAETVTKDPNRVALPANRPIEDQSDFAQSRQISRLSVVSAAATALHSAWRAAFDAGLCAQVQDIADASAQVIVWPRTSAAEMREGLHELSRCGTTVDEEDAGFDCLDPRFVCTSTPPSDSLQSAPNSRIAVAPISGDNDHLEALSLPVPPCGVVLRSIGRARLQCLAVAAAVEGGLRHALSSRYLGIASRLEISENSFFSESQWFSRWYSQALSLCMVADALRKNDKAGDNIFPDAQLNAVQVWTLAKACRELTINIARLLQKMHTDGDLQWSSTEHERHSYSRSLGNDPTHVPPAANAIYPSAGTFGHWLSAHKGIIATVYDHRAPAAKPKKVKASDARAQPAPTGPVAHVQPDGSNPTSQPHHRAASLQPPTQASATSLLLDVMSLIASLPHAKARSHSGPATSVTASFRVDSGSEPLVCAPSGSSSTSQCKLCHASLSGVFTRSHTCHCCKAEVCHDCLTTMVLKPEEQQLLNAPRKLEKGQNHTANTAMVALIQSAYTWHCLDYNASQRIPTPYNARSAHTNPLGHPTNTLPPVLQGNAPINPNLRNDNEVHLWLPNPVVHVSALVPLHALVGKMVCLSCASVVADGAAAYCRDTAMQHVATAAMPTHAAPTIATNPLPRLNASPFDSQTLAPDIAKRTPRNTQSSVAVAPPSPLEQLQSIGLGGELFSYPLNKAPTAFASVLPARRQLHASLVVETEEPRPKTIVSSSEYARVKLKCEPPKKGRDKPLTLGFNSYQDCEHWATAITQLGRSLQLNCRETVEATVWLAEDVSKTLKILFPEAANLYSQNLTTEIASAAHVAGGTWNNLTETSLHVQEIVASLNVMIHSSLFKSKTDTEDSSLNQVPPHSNHRVPRPVLTAMQPLPPPISLTLAPACVGVLWKHAPGKGWRRKLSAVTHGTQCRPVAVGESAEESEFNANKAQRTDGPVGRDWGESVMNVVDNDSLSALIWSLFNSGQSSGDMLSMTLLHYADFDDPEVVDLRNSTIFPTQTFPSIPKPNDLANQLFSRSLESAAKLVLRALLDNCRQLWILRQRHQQGTPSATDAAPYTSQNTHLQDRTQVLQPKRAEVHGDPNHQRLDGDVSCTTASMESSTQLHTSVKVKPAAVTSMAAPLIATLAHILHELAISHNLHSSAQFTQPASDQRLVDARLDSVLLDGVSAALWSAAQSLGSVMAETLVRDSECASRENHQTCSDFGEISGVVQLRSQLVEKKTDKKPTLTSMSSLTLPMLLLPLSVPQHRVSVVSATHHQEISPDVAINSHRQCGQRPVLQLLTHRKAAGHALPSINSDARHISSGPASRISVPAIGLMTVQLTRSEDPAMRLLSQSTSSLTARGRFEISWERGAVTLPLIAHSPPKVELDSIGHTSALDESLDPDPVMRSPCIAGGPLHDLDRMTTSRRSSRNQSALLALLAHAKSQVMLSNAASNGLTTKLQWFSGLTVQHHALLHHLLATAAETEGEGVGSSIILSSRNAETASNRDDITRQSDDKNGIYERVACIVEHTTEVPCGSCEACATAGLSYMRVINQLGRHYCMVGRESFRTMQETTSRNYQNAPEIPDSPHVRKDVRPSMNLQPVSIDLFADSNKPINPRPPHARTGAAVREMVVSSPTVGPVDIVRLDEVNRHSVVGGRLLSEQSLPDQLRHTPSLDLAASGQLVAALSLSSVAQRSTRKDISATPDHPNAIDSPALGATWTVATSVQPPGMSYGYSKMPYIHDEVHSGMRLLTHGRMYLESPVLPRVTTSTPYAGDLHRNNSLSSLGLPAQCDAAPVNPPSVTQSRRGEALATTMHAFSASRDRALSMSRDRASSITRKRGQSIWKDRNCSVRDSSTTPTPTRGGQVISHVSTLAAPESMPLAASFGGRGGKNTRMPDQEFFRNGFLQVSNVDSAAPNSFFKSSSTTTSLKSVELTPAALSSSSPPLARPNAGIRRAPSHTTSPVQDKGRNNSNAVYFPEAPRALSQVARSYTSTASIEAQTPRSPQVVTSREYTQDYLAPPRIPASSPLSRSPVRSNARAWRKFSKSPLSRGSTVPESGFSMAVHVSRPASSGSVTSPTVPLLTFPFENSRSSSACKTAAASVGANASPITVFYPIANGHHSLAADGLLHQPAKCATLHPSTARSLPQLNAFGALSNLSSVLTAPRSPEYCSNNMPLPLASATLPFPVDSPYPSPMKMIVTVDGSTQSATPRSQTLPFIPTKYFTQLSSPLTPLSSPRHSHSATPLPLMQPPLRSQTTVMCSPLHPSSSLVTASPVGLSLSIVASSASTATHSSPDVAINDARMAERQLFTVAEGNEADGTPPAILTFPLWSTSLSHGIKPSAPGVEPTGTVTLVFTDIQGSTLLWEKCGQAMELSLSAHEHALRELLRVHRGYEVKTEGDAFMVAFGSVIDAVLWTVNTQRVLCAIKWPAELQQADSAAVVPWEALNEREDQGDELDPTSLPTTVEIKDNGEVRATRGSDGDAKTVPSDIVRVSITVPYPQSPREPLPDIDATVNVVVTFSAVSDLHCSQEPQRASVDENDKLPTQTGNDTSAPPLPNVFHGLRVRMGIHTGKPSCRRNPVTNRYDYFGVPVNRAARVADSAHGGQVLATGDVVSLIDEWKQHCIDCGVGWAEAMKAERAGEERMARLEAEECELLANLEAFAKNRGKITGEDRHDHSGLSTDELGDDCRLPNAAAASYDTASVPHPHKMEEERDHGVKDALPDCATLNSLESIALDTEVSSKSSFCVKASSSVSLPTLSSKLSTRSRCLQRLRAIQSELAILSEEIYHTQQRRLDFETALEELVPTYAFDSLDNDPVMCHLMSDDMNTLLIDADGTLSVPHAGKKTVKFTSDSGEDEDVKIVDDKASRHPVAHDNSNISPLDDNHLTTTPNRRESIVRVPLLSAEDLVEELSLERLGAYRYKGVPEAIDIFEVQEALLRARAGYLPELRATRVAEVDETEDIEEGEKLEVVDARANGVVLTESGEAEAKTALVEVVGGRVDNNDKSIGNASVNSAVKVEPATLPEGEGMNLTFPAQTSPQRPPPQRDTVPEVHGEKIAHTVSSTATAEIERQSDITISVFAGDLDAARPRTSEEQETIGNVVKSMMINVCEDGGGNDGPDTPTSTTHGQMSSRHLISTKNAFLDVEAHPMSARHHFWPFKSAEHALKDVMTQDSTGTTRPQWSHEEDKFFI